MTLKIFMTDNFPSEASGQPICAVVIANSEEEARFLLEKDLRNDSVSTTDQFGVPYQYTMTTLKMYKPSVTVLTYGEPQ